MAISTAVSIDRISRIVGYKLKAANFAPDVPYLPQRIIVLGEANTANQGGLAAEMFDFTNAKEVGDRYGYGSPLHQMARILRPQNGNLLGGIPTVISPQISDVGATATVVKVGVTGTATANATHYIVVSGRDNVDGESYAINIVLGDIAAAIEAKIVDAINGVLGAPATAADNAGDIDITSKWEGVTAAELNVSFDTGNNAAGITYAEISKVPGAGVVTLTATLALWGSDWNTLVINPYTDLIDELEVFNGVPDPVTPTGQYTGIIFKPFIALFGSVLDTKSGLVAITDASARKSQVTNVLCPAPASAAHTWEAAANVGAVIAPIFQKSPHTPVSGRSYPDMPVPADGDINEMTAYDNRDYLVKRGCSTVNLTNGKFTIEDLITTYHPTGEVPPQFRYPRNLNIDFNVRYMYYLLEIVNVVDHSIAASDQPIRVDGVVKPKQWKQVLNDLADNMAEKNMIIDPDFMKDSIKVAISTVNPDRMETYFEYKRSGTVRIASTTAAAGFAFGVE